MSQRRRYHALKAPEFRMRNLDAVSGAGRQEIFLLALTIRQDQYQLRKGNGLLNFAFGLESELMNYFYRENGIQLWGERSRAERLKDSGVERENRFRTVAASVISRRNGTQEDKIKAARCPASARC